MNEPAVNNKSVSKDTNEGGNFVASFILMVSIIWLFYELAKLFAKKVYAYNCPNCNYDKVLWGEDCKNCGQKIQWPAKTREEYYAKQPGNLAHSN